jgi:hypothetical protein
MTNSNRFDVEPYVTKTPTDSYKAKDADSLDSNLLWYVKSRSQELLDLKPTLYTSLIHSTSVVNPNVKFVVIAGFPDSKNTSIIKQTSNFIVLDQTSLNEISHYEVNEIKLNPYMLYNVCGNDPRINHLSNINLDNLANCVNSAITNWDSSQFKLSKFVKNVINKKITSMEELHTYYVETGLFNKDWVNLVTQPTKTFRKTFLDIFRV